MERFSQTVPAPAFVEGAIDRARMALIALTTAGNRAHITVRKSTRTLEQNARMWAMLSDISEQVEWHGTYPSAEDWKDIFTASLKRQRATPGIDGGFVVHGERTSDMTKQEMSDLIELMEAFGAERGVKFRANV